MTVEVTLAIALDGSGETPAMIAVRLVERGGPMCSWQPELNGAPAKARFKFESEAARDRFLAYVSEIPRVSIAAN